jgi:multidrug efflux pump subunit AcrA (membrane-fusion protein)
VPRDHTVTLVPPETPRPPTPPPPPAPARRRRSFKPLVYIVLFGMLAAAAFLAGYLPRRHTQRELDAAAEKLRTTPPLVNSATAKRAAANAELILPGTVTPITEAYVFARASGYLRTRYVDIGDRVQAGQLLGEIDAPDLDQQVMQARAAVAQAESQLGQAQATLEQLIATRDLAAVTWERYKALAATGAVSRQDSDTQETASKTAEANVSAGAKAVRAAEENVRAAKAELGRLITLQGYEKITAPFAGIVTARNVDVGALISATGASQGPTRQSESAPSDLPSTGAIFRIAEIRRLRVLSAVPQMYLTGIKVGQAVAVTIQELPNLTFPGSVTRTSNSLDATTRTLLAEIQVDNPNGILLPGMYALLRFTIQRPEPPFLVPDAALVVRAQGPMLAVLQPQTQDNLRRVHFVAVQPGRNLGANIEILQGLKGGEEVAVSPGDAVEEGAIVRVAAGSK